MLIKHSSHNTNPNPKHDYTYSKSKAMILCHLIQTYWKKKGHEGIKAWPEKTSVRGRDHWVVKSNMKLSLSSPSPIPH